MPHVPRQVFAREQVSGRRAGGSYQPIGLLAEHDSVANRASPVTFGVFRYAWRDFWGTIHMCCVRSGPSAVR